MQSTHPTGTHRICYQCDNHARSGSMFCLQCLPERMPPIIREKPPKPPRRSLWQLLRDALRIRSHARTLSSRLNDVEAELRDTQAANKALRLRGKDLKTQLVELTRAFDDCDAERSKLARKLTDAAIAWAPVAQWARETLGNDAELPAIASFDVERLKQPCDDKNADLAVSRNSDQSAAPLGQNPESEIAPGHNPDGLTVAQVGEGFRLLFREEIETRRELMKARKNKPDLEARCSGEWVSRYFGTNFSCTYRVRI